MSGTLSPASYEEQIRLLSERVAALETALRKIEATDGGEWYARQIAREALAGAVES